MRWWGWATRDRAAGLRRMRSRTCARASAWPSARARPSRSRTSRSRRQRSPSSARGAARGRRARERARRYAERVAPRRRQGYPTSCACALATRTAPRRGRAARGPRAGSRGARGVRARTGCCRSLRGRHERRRRPRAAAGRARERRRARYAASGRGPRASTRVAARDRRRWDQGAGAREPPRRARTHARPLPQSYEFVSLGGCAATRSAGQASSGYGLDREDDPRPAHVRARGRRRARPRARERRRTDLRALLVGSEGTLGVICELSLRARVAPADRAYEGCSSRRSTPAFRPARARTAHAVPEVARLSDEEETRMSLALAGVRGAKDRLGGCTLGCAAIAAAALRSRLRGRGERGLDEAQARARARAPCGRPVRGCIAGEAWRRARFAAPYLRDELLTHGVMVETLETATQWSNLAGYARRRARAFASARRAATPVLVMCHVSHLYETGASLYFTFIARQREGEEIASGARRRRRRAGDLRQRRHDHPPPRRRSRSRAVDGARGRFGGIAALRALKSELDPAGVMNPGKLLV